MEKLLSGHRFGHSVFTRRKIINKIFTKLFWDAILLRERYITLQGSGHSNLGGVTFYNCGVNLRNAPARRLFELL